MADQVKSQVKEATQTAIEHGVDAAHDAAHDAVDAAQCAARRHAPVPPAVVAHHGRVGHGAHPLWRSDMAELTHLDDKLGEVLGLARAAQDAAEKVSSLCQDDAADLLPQLDQMHEEAKETERRTAQYVASLEGKKTAIEEKASATKREAVEMMRTYLGENADALDGFEFLVMAEAAELGHWQVVGKMNERAGESAVGELVDFAVPIQQRHFETVREGSLVIAGREDPAASA